MHYKYQTKGVCATKIEFDCNHGIITNIEFTGGCPGYSKVFSKLLNGHTKEEIIELCEGNLCGKKQTSCADQLAKALKQSDKEA